MTISVVIPALNEAQRIAGAIESAARGAASGASGRAGESPSARSARNAPSPRSSRTGGAPIPAAGGRARDREVGPDEPVEICVVDGGSRDDTVERARQCAGSLEPTVSFSVIEFGALGRPAGRAAQLQAGVEATIGDAVVLLHADTRLPLGWSRLVRTALSRAGVCGGAFRFAFDEVGDRSRAPTSNERAALRFVERGARLRVALFGLPYGDQALFVRRSALEAIGGIPQVGWMEDLDLVRALKQHGRLAMLDAPAPTSPRRHLDRGVWRTALRHTAAAGAWAAGVDRRRIARWVKR